MIGLASGYAIAAVAIQFAWAMPVGAEVFMLVSRAEVAEDRAAAPRRPATRGAMRPMPNLTPDPKAPRIDVLAPEIVGGRPLVVPFLINVHFIASAGREIDPATFRILYGRLGLDITSRILAATKVTQEGLNVPSARVPKGSHKFVIEIRDDADNIGRRELAFEVGD